MKKPKMEYRYTVNFQYNGVKDVYILESSKILDEDDVFYTLSRELNKTIDNFRKSKLIILEFYLVD